MDVCIRAGYYEAAYSLTNYGMMLQQHSIIKNPLVKARIIKSFVLIILNSEAEILLRVHAIASEYR